MKKIDLDWKGFSKFQLHWHLKTVPWKHPMVLKKLRGGRGSIRGYRLFRSTPDGSGRHPWRAAWVARTWPPAPVRTWCPGPRIKITRITQRSVVSKDWQYLISRYLQSRKIEEKYHHCINIWKKMRSIMSRTVSANNRISVLGLSFVFSVQAMFECHLQGFVVNLGDTVLCRRRKKYAK